MTVYHHRAAQIVANQILDNWRGERNWSNAFVSNVVEQSMTPNEFPSPDAHFQDRNRQTKISLEFKPFTETKRGIMTGLGQTIGYLNKAHASILVCSSKIEEFDMKKYLKKTFEKFIYGKLPIALFTYDGENLDNLEMVVNIDQTLFSKKNIVRLPYRGSGTPYFAFWRDLPIDGFYKLALSSKTVTSKKERSEQVWDEFFYTFYAPKKSLETLEDIESEILFEDMKTKLIPFSSRKKELREKVKNNEINEKEALKILEKKSWSKKSTDNNYRDYKKNHYNFMNHNKLWDEDFYLTELGNKFIQRYEDNIKYPKKLIDEMAQIVLVSGKHHSLIEEIIEITQKIEHAEDLSSDQKYLKKVYNEMDQRGHVAKNVERVTSGTRDYLRSEKQLWGRLDLIKKNNNRYFFDNLGYLFNKDRILDLVEKFYINYGDTIYKKDYLIN